MRRSRLVLALRLRYLYPMGISHANRDNFTFLIKTWFLCDPKYEEIVAGASGISVAIAAFEEQVKHVAPTTAVLLVQGGRVIRKWPSDIEI